MKIMLLRNGRITERAKPFVGVPRLEPHVYSDSEYEKMKKTINKMTKNGIVLCRKICGFP